jgi:hypothetical protein
MGRAGDRPCPGTDDPTRKINNSKSRSQYDRYERSRLAPIIIARTNDAHADDVPCVIALPISLGHPEYLRWIYDETRQSTTQS